MYEVKKQQQFFQFALVGAAGLQISVESEYLFRTSDNENLIWWLELEGKLLHGGELPLRLTLGERRILTLDPQWSSPARAGTLTLQGYVQQPAATPWSPAGHISAWEHWPRPRRSRHPPAMYRSSLRPPVSLSSHIRRSAGESTNAAAICKSGSKGSFLCCKRP
ncbi:MAG: beta-galactosidase domain 4-containing protein [Sodalis sp. (in: enterobacteria)]|uniref:beta-galactosidase domain 4-containing protein n=1 Tax=Sodalis sp. (in: enterobacteria) TaxID=1898979 RepID=UPI003F3DAA85